jgi:hypothetical protein
MIAQITSTMVLFYTVYAALLLLCDAGLYTVAWHRSILADKLNSARYNRAYNASPQFNDLQATLETESDALNAETRTVALQTFDRQRPKPYGSAYQHFDMNFGDCLDVRKSINIPNTEMGRETILQQVLADHTLNFFRCILSGRLSSR